MVQEELRDAAGAAAPRLADRLGEASRAFERDRFTDARAILVPLAARAPSAASVRELLGLTYYRLGQWTHCIKELTAYHDLTGSSTCHAYLADAHRALGRHAEVERLWEELRVDSPDANTVAEGRIVLAGSLADRGRIVDAIALLEKSKLSAKKIEDHHLRLWYALADLYERSGEVPRARELFGRIATHSPDFVDVADRRRALG